MKQMDQTKNKIKVQDTVKMSTSELRSLTEPPMSKIDTLTNTARRGTEEQMEEAVKELEKEAISIGDNTEEAINSLAVLVLVNNKANMTAFKALCGLSGSLIPEIKENAKNAIKIIAKDAEDPEIRRDAKIELGEETN
jgi:hypothetical protein